MVYSVRQLNTLFAIFVRLTWMTSFFACCIGLAPPSFAGLSCAQLLALGSDNAIHELGNRLGGTSDIRAREAFQALRGLVRNSVTARRTLRSFFGSLENESVGNRLVERFGQQELSQLARELIEQGEISEAILIQFFRGFQGFDDLFYSGSATRLSRTRSPEGLSSIALALATRIARYYAEADDGRPTPPYLMEPIGDIEADALPPSLLTQRVLQFIRHLYDQHARELKRQLRDLGHGLTPAQQFRRDFALEQGMDREFIANELRRLFGSGPITFQPDNVPTGFDSNFVLRRIFFGPPDGVQISFRKTERAPDPTPTTNDSFNDEQPTSHPLINTTTNPSAAADLKFLRLTLKFMIFDSNLFGKFNDLQNPPC